LIRLNLRSVVVVLLVSFPAFAGPREDQTYKQLELFARVLSYVENNYVEPVDDQQLMYGAIKGMLDTLDPHTVFMPPEVFKEMKIDTSGEYGGLGIEIAKKNDVITIVTPVDDTPAARAGIKAGDQLLAIDGEATKGMDVGRALQKLRGPAGKKVTLTILRDGFSAPRDIAIIRDHIKIPSVEGNIYGGIGWVHVKNFQERTDFSLKRSSTGCAARTATASCAGWCWTSATTPAGCSTRRWRSPTGSCPRT
jgi:carboxyl-terminal processing protease